MGPMDERVGRGDVTKTGLEGMKAKGRCGQGNVNEREKGECIK